MRPSERQRERDALVQSYIIISPDSPSDDEYRRGASLVPSMLDEGVRVWRVPAKDGAM